jgi:uncharacterized membrane protein
VFPNTPIAVIRPRIDGAGEAILQATALGAQRRGEVDLDYTVAQLVEVAVRALSSGVNDPQTAISVLDRLGSSLCMLAGAQLANGVTAVHGRPVLVVPLIDYEGLVDAMLQMIRQNAAGRPPVYNKLLQVLTAVAGCERDPARVAILRRHADRVMADAERTVASPGDLEEVRRKHAKFTNLANAGSVAAALAG